MKSALSLSAEKRGTYPFVSQNIDPNGPILVKNARNRKDLMKRYGLLDANDFSSSYIKTKKKRFKDKQGKENKEEIEKIFKQAKAGKIDTRKMDLARRKREYQIRNGYVKP